MNWLAVMRKSIKIYPTVSYSKTIEAWSSISMVELSNDDIMIYQIKVSGQDQKSST